MITRYDSIESDPRTFEIIIQKETEVLLPELETELLVFPIRKSNGNIR